MIHPNHCYRLIGNVVDYDYFAEFSQHHTEEQILEILGFLLEAELDGQSLHERHQQRGYKGGFSNEKPGASLWKIDLVDIDKSENLLHFYCDEIDQSLASTICKLIKGNLAG